MTRDQAFMALLAINGALPFFLSWLAGRITAGAATIVLVFAAAVALVFLNETIVRRYRPWRWIIRTLTAGNLLATLLFGSVALITALPAIVLFVLF